MEPELCTFEFNVKRTPHSISIWIKEEDNLNLYDVFTHWSHRTDEFTDDSLASYIHSKGHFALTETEYNHRIKLKPYFDRSKAGEDIEQIIKEILAKKGMIDELEQVINSYYEDCDENPTDPREMKLAYIKEDFPEFVDYLADLPLLDE